MKVVREIGHCAVLSSACGDESSIPLEYASFCWNSTALRFRYLRTQPRGNLRMYLHDWKFRLLVLIRAEASKCRKRYRIVYRVYDSVRDRVCVHSTNTYIILVCSYMYSNLCVDLLHDAMRCDALETIWREKKIYNPLAYNGNRFLLVPSSDHKKCNIFQPVTLIT